MNDPASRYKNVGRSFYTTPEGAHVSYWNRRFSPPGRSLPLYAETTVGPGDRLDLVASRTLNNPLTFWLVADANDAMNPFDLTAVVGRKLRVPMPQPG